MSDLTPTNPRYVADKIVHVAIQSHKELSFVARSVFVKALDEPSLCEAYADLVCNLHYHQYHCQQLSPMESGGKCFHFKTFMKELLNLCNYEFYVIADVRSEKEPRLASDRELAFMQFMGHLFLRRLVSASVIDTILSTLLCMESENNNVPVEHHIYCACELLSIAGSRVNKDLLFLQRLRDLRKKQLVRADGCATALCTDALLHKIDETFALHNQAWPLPKLVLQLEQMYEQIGERRRAGRKKKHMHKYAPVIRVTSLSAKQCATIDGTLEESWPEELLAQIADQCGVKPDRIGLVDPSGWLKSREEYFERNVF
jgi:hypothetical protein